MAVKGGNRPHRSAQATSRDRLQSLVKQPNSRASLSYLKLASAFPIRPLRTDGELKEAIQILDGLLSRKKALDAQEQGYLDSLGHEIRLYEEANIPMPQVSGAALLRHLIEDREETFTGVAAATGIAISTISSIVGGKRQLNLSHIEKLSSYFGVSPRVFLN